MATETAAETRPTDVGLRREVGLIGAIWASETSIIGSGWLFASMNAAVIAGAASIYGWLIGGVCVIILALIHAELGGMYPVAGGTARFPHLAYGSVAGISFGFFSWLQAVTVAPIECFAVMQYASYYWPSLYNGKTGVTTGWGFFWTVILMAVFTAFNFLAVRLFARVNSTITWWKVAIPILTIIIFFFKFHPGNFTAGAGGFFPVSVKTMFGTIPAVGIVFSYLGFEQADQLAGEIKNPQRNLPRAMIIACCLGTAIYILLRVDAHRRRAAQRAHPRLRRACLYEPDNHLPVRRRGRAGRARLLGDDPAHRRVRLPVRHRDDLPDLHLAGRVRPGQEPVLPADLPVGRPERRAVVQPDHGVRVRSAVPAAVPELEVSWSAWSPARAC